MKDYPHMPGWRLNKSDNKPTIKHSILMLTTHGVAEGEWDGNEWIQYRWSAKVKDSDVYYWLYLEDLTQLEKEGDSLQQEQPADWSLVEEEPTCKESLQVEEEHPDNFTSFEWIVGRLMFRGCDLWGMTDGEDDNGIVTELIKDRAVEMMALLERELDSNAEPVDLEEEIKKHTDLFQADIEYPLRLTAIKFYELGKNTKK